MWFNSMIREEPYPGSNGIRRLRETGAFLRDVFRGAAWLSSARAVRCRIKFLNERNPCVQLLTVKAEDSARTAGASREEGGDDVKSARPLRPGRHTCYNGRHSGKPCGDTARNPKTALSSDRSLQPDSVKLDSLVIAHQPWRGEYVPGPCTHRPSSHGSRERLKCVAARRALERNRRLGLSRNKVAVPEGAAGTPPFWRVPVERVSGTDRKTLEAKARQGIVIERRESPSLLVL